MASQQPARPESIILVEGGSYFPEKMLATMLEWGLNDDAEYDSQIQSLEEQLPNVVESYQSDPPELPAIQAKTLIVFGDRDQLYPVSLPVEMYKEIPNAFLWIVPNAIHGFLVSNTDKYAAEFIRTTLAFLHNKL